MDLKRNEKNLAGLGKCVYPHTLNYKQLVFGHSRELEILYGFSIFKIDNSACTKNFSIHNFIFLLLNRSNDGDTGKSFLGSLSECRKNVERLKIMEVVVFGWGTRDRTWAARSRIWRPTARRSPNLGMSLIHHSEAVKRRQKGLYKSWIVAFIARSTPARMRWSDRSFPNNAITS